MRIAVAHVQPLLLSVVFALLAGCGAMPKEGPAPVESRRAGQQTVTPKSAPQLVAPAQAPIVRQRGLSSSDQPVAKPLPRYSPPPSEAMAMPVPDRGGTAIPATGSVAVVSLINSADGSRDPNRAAAVLERALRIEPNNPVIWHRLAAARLQQGRYAQAEAVALKSNALEAGDSRLWKANWGIVAEARTALGDQSGAAEAERKRRSGKR